MYEKNVEIQLKKAKEKKESKSYDQAELLKIMQTKLTNRFWGLMSR